MESKRIFYWLSRITILIILGTTIFLSGITMAIILVRILPFMSPFLNANTNAISSAQGSQFVNAAFPVREANQALLQRMRVDPLLPVLIGVSILRKIRPIDNLLKRFLPPRNNANNPSQQNNQVPDIHMEIPEATNLFESDGSLSGIAPGDNMDHFKGKYMNVALSFLFLLLVIIFMILTTSFINYLIKSFNNQSKNLVSGTAQLSADLQALPATLDEIYKKDNSLNNKKVPRSRKKLSS